MGVSDAPLTDQASRFEQFGIGRLFRLVRDGVVIADAASERIIAWNDCAGEIFGYSEVEALELPLHALVPEDLRDVHRTGIASYQRTGTGNLIDSGHPVELKGLHKDGHEVPIELTLTRIPEVGPNGERFALAIIRDVTDRKEAEKAALIAREIAARQEQALKLNDGIVQGLAIAKMAIETGEVDKGLEAIGQTLQQAKSVVAELLENLDRDRGIHAGDLKSEPDE